LQAQIDMNVYGCPPTTLDQIIDTQIHT